MDIRRPLLAKGIKAAGLEVVVFLTIGGHAFQLSGYAFIALEGSNTPRSAPPDPILRIRFHHQNPSVLKSVFKA